ncbi:MAG TPA: hypothetical protein VFJ19_09315 [Nocardioidaceae bacterium]|nr:hypothetical protein [Nocardioidaceae bacterium]
MADRTETVRLRGDSSDLIGAIRRAEIAVDRLDDKLAAYARQRPSATLSVETAEAQRRLDKMRAQLARVGSAHADVDVDAAAALAELAAVDAGIDRIDGRTARVDVNTSGAQRRFSLLLNTGIALGPALVPVGAEISAAFLGAAGTVGAFGAGLGTTLLAARGVGTALQAVAKVQDSTTKSAKTSATAEANLAAAMGNLSDEGKRFVLFLYGLKPKLDDLRATAQKGLFPGLESGLTQLEALLPTIDRLVGSTAGELGHLADEAGHALTDPFWTNWFGFVADEAAPTLDTFAHVIGNLATGFAGMLQAVAPLSHDVGDELESLTADFSRWGQELDESSAMHEFITYVRQNGPVVADTLGSIAHALVAVSTAAAPIGPVVLRAVEGIADAIAAIASSPVGPTLVGIASGLGAVNIALKLYDSAKASKLLTTLAGIRTNGLGAAGGLSKLGIAGAGIAIAIPVWATVVKGLDDVIGNTPPDVDELTASLQALGRVSGYQRLTDYAESLRDVDKAAKSVADAPPPDRLLRVLDNVVHLFGAVPGSFTKVGEFTGNIESLDKALAQLVTSGRADLAAAALNKILAAMSPKGRSDLIGELKDYKGAVQDAGAAASTGEGQVRGLSDAQATLGLKTANATQQLLEQQNALHRLSDPLFALADALDQQKQAEADAAEAVKKHGSASAEARAANLKLAEAALSVTDAAQTLRLGMEDGSISISKASDMLHSWVAAGLLTSQQAHDVGQQLGGLIGQAQDLSQTPASLTVKANTQTAHQNMSDLLGLAGILGSQYPIVKVGTSGIDAADSALAGILSKMLAINSTPVNVPTASGPTGSTGDVLGGILSGSSGGSSRTYIGGGQRKAGGGWMVGPGTATSDSIPALLSNGEFVVNARSAAMFPAELERINRYADGGWARFASGGSVTDRISQTITAGMSAPTSQAISASIAGVGYLVQLWQQGNQLAEQARQRADLVAAISKANAQLAAEQAKGAKGDIASATEAVQNATRALTDFDRQAAQDAQQRRYDAAQTALQARQQLAANKEQWQFEHETARQQVADITKRMAAEQEYSDEWLRLAEQRQSIQEEIDRAAQQAYDDARQKASDALSTLNGLLDQQASLTQRLTQAQADYASGVADAQQQLATSTQQAIQSRLKELTSTDLTQSNASLVGWTSTDQDGADAILKNLGLLSSAMDAFNSQNAMSAEQLTANVDQQIQTMQQWSDDLAQLRARGLSDQVVQLLGLDKGPEALAQVRALTQGTDAQLQALNDSVVQYTQAAGVEVQREQTGLYGDLGQQLLDLQSQFNSRVADLQNTLISTTQDVQTQLAALGQTSGRSYADALAAGINSGIPGIIAAAQAAMAAASQAASLSPDAIRNLSTPAGGAAHGTAIGVPLAKPSVVITYAPQIDARYGTESTATMIDHAQRRFLQDFAAVAGAGLAT